ncbi:hypothetical protein LTR37_015603 [Vermiconidia calcicola]|uniref:Uncharacterized protein n=1 Tax=Vermiconidia calcicola TaxID=1690605 RepID=A0ACC3MRG8_9PEZI|nr:hypothetical protein LTR37_015603 [Vermiconidia calcicola]
MHWRAIRRSAGSCESRSCGGFDGAPPHHERLDVDEGNLRLAETGTPIRQGQDEALDDISDLLLSVNIRAAEMNEQHSRSNTNTRSTDEEGYFQVSMPTTSFGLTTFAYQRALRNRIKHDKLTKHGEYDMHKYTPTFIHDCLMLPGSLANVLGKASAEEIIHRMTPALLPGFHAYVNSKNQQPCLLQSSNSEDYVKGMVIFGQGREARDCIHRHYRSHARRVKVQIEVDVQVPESNGDGESPYMLWYLQRKKTWAHAWLWSNVSSVDAEFRATAPCWTLEDYLAGNLKPAQGIRIEPGGFIGDNYDPDVDEVSGERGGDDGGAVIPKSNQQRERREVVYGGAGPLDYQRTDAAIGWW